MSYLRSTIIIALAAPLAACVTSIRDLSAGPVTVLATAAAGQLPERPRVSVRLRTRTDLSKVPSEELIHAEASFCDSPKDFVLLGRTIYVDPPLTSLRDAGRSNPADSSGVYTYVVLLDVKRQGSPDSRPPEIGFDLSTVPRSVCIKLMGGYIGESVSSNTVQVSAETIREALAHHEVSRGG